MESKKKAQRHREQTGLLVVVWGLGKTGKGGQTV